MAMNQFLNPRAKNTVSDNLLKEKADAAAQLPLIYLRNEATLYSAVVHGGKCTFWGVGGLLERNLSIGEPGFNCHLQADTSETHQCIQKSVVL